MNSTKETKVNLQTDTLAPVLYAVTIGKCDAPIYIERPDKFTNCFGFYTNMTDAQNKVDEILQEQAKLGNIVVFRDPLTRTVVRPHDDPAVILVIDIIAYSFVHTTDPRILSAYMQRPVTNASNPYVPNVFPANLIYGNIPNNNDVLVFAVISEYAYDTKAYRTNLSMSYKCYANDKSDNSAMTKFLEDMLCSDVHDTSRVGIIVDYLNTEIMKLRSKADCSDTRIKMIRAEDYIIDFYLCKASDHSPTLKPMSCVFCTTYSLD